LSREAIEVTVCADATLAGDVPPLHIDHPWAAYRGPARTWLQGETAKARAAYLDFLTLWKDADPDIPILKEAKAEYAKLQ
jgi:hypothetical protein